MSIRVDKGYSAFFNVSSGRDQEWQRIIDRLWNKYGIRSTGSKTSDKMKLHELELKEVKELEGECSSSKFITISSEELERYRKKRRDKKIEKNPKDYPHTAIGAEILGKQIFLAIQIKKEEDDRDNKKRRDNKYQA